MNSIEFKTLVFLRFSDLRVITKLKSGDYLVKSGKTVFRVDIQTVAAAVSSVDWILFPPRKPWRPDRIGGRTPADPELFNIPFGDWLAVENLYHGYIATQNPEILRSIAAKLLPRFHRRLRRWELEIVFRWIASVKDNYAKRFRNFYSDVADENSLGSGSAALSRETIENAMNAQIRALTKGDISKEQEILSMPALRALIELDAQAREFKELDRKANANKK